MSADNGGPAFPTPSGHATIEQFQPGVGRYHKTVEVCKTGMSLRDWFAGQMLSGMTLTLDTQNERSLLREHAADIAQVAYYVADAMLQVRESARKR